MTRELHLPEETFKVLLEHSYTLDLKSKQKVTQGARVIASIQNLSAGLIESSKKAEEQ